MVLGAILVILWLLFAFDLRICLRRDGLILWAETISRRLDIESVTCFVGKASHYVALAGLELTVWRRLFLILLTLPPGHQD